MIGIDSNGDGKLNPNETRHRIGQCPWAWGMNEGWIERSGGNWYVHWLSYDDRNRNGHRDIGEGMVHFIYKIDENKLKVYRSPCPTQSGILEYQSSPENYPGWLR